MTDRRVPAPTELIYLPEPSWQPVLIAAGLGGVIAGIYIFWPYAVVGAAVALIAFAAWVRDARRDFARLPQRQRISSAPIPPASPSPVDKP
jgi:hypothetical protein